MYIQNYSYNNNFSGLVKIRNYKNNKSISIITTQKQDLALNKAFTEFNNADDLVKNFNYYLAKFTFEVEKVLSNIALPTGKSCGLGFINREYENHKSSKVLIGDLFDFKHVYRNVDL